MSAFHPESMQHGMMLINAKTGTPVLNNDGTILHVQLAYQPAMVNPGQGASYMHQGQQQQQQQQPAQQLQVQQPNPNQQQQQQGSSGQQQGLPPGQMVISQQYVGMQQPFYVVLQPVYNVPQLERQQYASQQTIQEHQNPQFGDCSEGLGSFAKLGCPAGEEEMEVDSLMSGDHRELREDDQKLSERITILKRQLENSLNCTLKAAMETRQMESSLIVADHEVLNCDGRQNMNGNQQQAHGLQHQ